MAQFENGIKLESQLKRIEVILSVLKIKKQQ
jgi:hypothetical protein